MANPLLSELLSLTQPEDFQPTKTVEYAGQKWEFRTAIPERVENWKDTKLPLGNLGTAAAITGPTAAELIAALKSINGKPLAAYVSEDLEIALAPIKASIAKGQRALSEEEIGWITEATSMDLMLEALTTKYTREFLMGLYEVYVTEVRDPAKKRLSDFFASLPGTTPTPASR